MEHHFFNYGGPPQPHQPQMPYGSLPYQQPMRPINTGDVGFDTSSNDPAKMRARVFCGGVLRGRVTRDDVIELFAPYGNLLALTLFESFAFIQFEDSREADAAVVALHGRNFHGFILDVKLAYIRNANGTLTPRGGKGGRKRGPQSNDGSGSNTSWESGGGSTSTNACPIGGGGGRGGDDARDHRFDNRAFRSSEEAAATTSAAPQTTAAQHDAPAQEDNYVDDTAAIFEKNKQFAAGDTTDPEADFQTHRNEEMVSQVADTLICGQCRYTTHDYGDFRNHRLAGCAVHKHPDEPYVLVCCQCSVRHASAWALLGHLASAHNMALYVDVTEQQQKRESNGGAAGAGERAAAEAH